MNNKHILHITAVAEATPQGQKCTKAVLEYDRPMSADVSPDAYRVEGRTVTGVSVEGSVVTLSLSPEDKAAATYCQGNPWEGTATVLRTASVAVAQVTSVAGLDGSVLEPAPADVNDRVETPIVDDFIQGEFEGLAYNLYIPKDCRPGETYPLVQFIHDAGPCGPEPKLTLTQGLGAIVWARPEEQAKRKCFVLAPQFDGPPIVDDDWNVDPRLETAKRLLDWVCGQNPVDRTRLYTTGQSMGCMSSIVLNVRYPELFAASFLVAGQWDDRQIPGLERQHLWMLNSQGDAKAFPGMNQMACEMESKGAKVARKVIDAKASQEALQAVAQELVSTGANVIYTPYRIESVARGWHSRGGEHHVTTWQTAYEIEAIRAWLFTNQKAR